VRKKTSIRRGGVSSIRDALHVYLRQSGLGTKLRDRPVYEAWSSACGEKLARRAQAVQFRGGELVVEVESAAHLQELKNFTGEGYRNRANQQLGSARIERVVFKLKS
jgi:hypothetical protein